MSNHLIETILAKSADPIFLVNSEGAILWCNQAGAPLSAAIAPSTSLAPLLGIETVAEIRATKHYTTLEVTPLAGHLKGLRQTAILIEVSHDQLEDRSFLVILVSAANEGSSLKEKQEWLTSAAHDLKNPLSAIFGYADTLLDTSAGVGLSPEQRAIIARIRGTASRATELVRNYQHLSHIALRGVAQSGSKVDLNAAILDVINTTWREDPQHPRVALSLAQMALPATVDRLHLDRVIANLFSNALKFSPSDSTVTLTTGCDPDGGVWCTVHNWGKAIPEGELPHLFTPFNRLSNSRGKPGSGLGLTIVKRIVEGVGGRLSVSSSQELGTTFSVHLPG